MTTRHTCALIPWIIALAITLLPARAAAQHEHDAASTAARQMLLGSVFCAEAGPLSGAVVQLFHEAGAEQHLVASTLTDGAGRFSVRSGPGSYMLRITYVGHETHERPVLIGAAPLNLGAVSLNMAALHLDAIQVSAERERMQLRSGATIVDARSAATAAGGSIADLLRTVPGLEIDAEGRITMRGSSVLVLINGRRTALSEEALVAFLRQMPASTLERVEAGTSASARQDADGAGGIVNLVFAENGAVATRTLSLSLADHDYYSAAGAAGGAVGERVGWNASYAFSAMRPLTASHTARDNTAGAGAGSSSHQSSAAVAKHRLHSVTLGSTLQIGYAGSLGARAAYSRMTGAYDNRTDFLDMSAVGTAEQSSTTSVLEHTIPTAEAALSWTWAGAGPRRLGFTSELRAGTNRQDFAGTYADGAGLEFLDTEMRSRLTEYVWQNDVAFDVRGIRVETGHKSQLGSLRAKYDVQRAAETAARAFEYVARVHAAYASAHGSVGTVQLQAGLRAESDETTVQMETRRATSTVRFFPSVLVQWPYGTAARTRVRASYTRRLDRPDAAALNPYSMGEDDMNEFVGNPELRPEVSDLIELGIEHAAAGVTMQLTPFLRVTRDPIRPLKAVTESGRATTSLHNLSAARAVGADASVRSRFGERVTTTLSATLFGMRTEGLHYRSEGLFFTARALLDVRLAEGTTLQLYGYRRGAQPVEQGEILPSTTTEVSLTRSFADERGRLTLRMRDPFRTERLAFHLADDGFVQHSTRRVNGPRATLFFSWSIGAAQRAENVPVQETPPRIF